jgi:hypothetical protein
MKKAVALKMNVNTQANGWAAFANPPGASG